MVDFPSSNSFMYRIQLPSPGQILVLLKGHLLELNQGMSLYSELQKTLENNPNSQVLLHLQDLEFMNSEGLNTLIRCLSLVRKNGGDLFVFNPNSSLKSLFISTKLNEVFPSVNDPKNWLVQTPK
jgi:anti-anti-sigma factor